MKSVTMYTDGACSGNPGPGGWAAILKFQDEKHDIEKVVNGCAVATTNNRMELSAVIGGIKALKCPCEVTVYTDSQYLVSCSAHDKEWFKSLDRPNKDLWFELIEEGNKGHHHIKFIKVKGHGSDAMNKRCDKIAKEQAVRARHILAGHIKE